MKLGYEKEGQTFGAWPSANWSRQHQMHNVLGHVVLTGGYETLNAFNTPSAVTVVYGLGPACTDVGTGVWLC
ncbi:unannotated protein [freshwater metagenome]|uniref:Unannotated protein n=1 Tax=freshwater metagenome TaxID=449393 RepID=A0A6J6UHD6_9ZZZZ